MGICWDLEPTTLKIESFKSILSRILEYQAKSGGFIRPQLGFKPQPFHQPGLAKQTVESNLEMCQVVSPSDLSF